jgi:hypothetical protein
MNGEVQPVTSRLIYTKKKTVYLNILTWEGLPRWISEEAKRAVFRSISNALTTNVLQLVTPVIVATQLQINIRDLHEVHTIFLRAMPRYQGIVAQDCVKVLIDEDNDDGTSKKSVYFGKCVAFLQDSDGKQFVVLQWFIRHEDNGFDLISKVPSFKLAPEGHTKSFSTLPLDAILNGAIMVPGGGRFWALLSPREQMLYTKLFQ